MLLGDYSGPLMKIPPARVITPSPPRGEHFVLRGTLGAAHRKARHEALVIRNHRGDLRLRQHDFGTRCDSICTICQASVTSIRVLPLHDFLQRPSLRPNRTLSPPSTSADLGRPRNGASPANRPMDQQSLVARSPRARCFAHPRGCAM